MSKQFILRLIVCVFLGVCSAGALQAARDCSGCGGDCDGTSNSSAKCMAAGITARVKTCKKDGSGECQSGCSCNSGGVRYAACACS